MGMAEKYSVPPYNGTPPFCVFNYIFYGIVFRNLDSTFSITELNFSYVMYDVL